MCAKKPLWFRQQKKFEINTLRMLMHFFVFAFVFALFKWVLGINYNTGDIHCRYYWLQFWIVVISVFCCFRVKIDAPSLCFVSRPGTFIRRNMVIQNSMMNEQWILWYFGLSHLHINLTCSTMLWLLAVWCWAWIHLYSTLSDEVVITSVTDVYHHGRWCRDGRAAVTMGTRGPWQQEWGRIVWKAMKGNLQGLLHLLDGGL